MGVTGMNLSACCHACAGERAPPPRGAPPRARGPATTALKERALRSLRRARPKLRVAARSHLPLASLAAALACPVLAIDSLAEFLGRFEYRHPLGGHRHRGARPGIAPTPGRPLAHGKAAKAAQLHPFPQGEGGAHLLQYGIHDP